MVADEMKGREQRAEHFCKPDATPSAERARGPEAPAAICAPPSGRRSSPDFTARTSSSSARPRRSCARHTMVRLITHNLLACHAKGCTSNNFPLQFKDVQVELREAEFNPDFLRGFISRLEWGALVDAARQVSFSADWAIGG